MAEEITLVVGKTLQWQKLHRSTRLRLYPDLIGRRISYRTYFMRDNNQPAERLDVLDVVELRSRGAGSDRAFVGYDATGALTQIAWARIVEVTPLEYLQGILSKPSTPDATV